MTTAKELKQKILNHIAKTLKVKKTWEGTGRDNYGTGQPVELEDFVISFELPEDLNIDSHGFNNHKFEAEFRIRFVHEGVTFT